MPARALFVLLVMLNLGVATWWLLRPGPPAPAPRVQPADVPRLQLLGEHGPATAATGVPGRDAPAPDPPPAAGPQEIPVAPVATAGLRCLGFGPFTDAVSVAAARAALQPLGAARTRVRD